MERDSMTTEELHEIVNDKFDCVFEKIDRLNIRLFVDNNGESIQSKLNRLDRWVKVVTGIMAAIGLTVLGIIGWVIKGWIS